MQLTIATRQSRLALWQAHYVKNKLQSLYPDCHLQIMAMSTRGDQILDRALSKVGGKGLFIKELEVSLEQQLADLAVHSAKDVPMELAHEFHLLGFMHREDPKDAFVSNHYHDLEALPAGAVVGTSSLRRQAQLLSRFPHLKVLPLRGNLDTRLAKLDSGDYAAIILAAAGLKRLGLENRIRTFLPFEISLPAAGQGALALEILANRLDLHQHLQALICPVTTACVKAERVVSKMLGGSCQVPLAAFAEINDQQQIYLRASVTSIDGSAEVFASDIGSLDEPESLGHRVAQSLLAQGGHKILQSCLTSAP
jgi:hydroxymethylbilane synthase